MRYVGDPRLVDVRSLPASGEFVSPSSLLHSRLWHCQTMRTEKTREWAFWNHGAGQRNRQWKDGFLTQGEVQWIMVEEGNPFTPTALAHW